VVSCRFLEEKDGEARILSFFAKKARGLIARFAIDNRIDRVADLRAFEREGYRFAGHLSSDAELTFVRPQPPAGRPGPGRGGGGPMARWPGRALGSFRKSPKVARQPRQAAMWASMSGRPVLANTSAE